jgi:hypothetical protein
MGYGSYSSSSRSLRAASSGYSTKSRDDIFTQNKEGKMHKDMDPKGVVTRICADSSEHPNVIPIQFYLDVTGSMGHIPHQMIKEGLPVLMGSLTQNGVPDASLLFGAIGDHECDRCPLQIGQFEAGDAELDMWLTRTYLEGGGGGNAGESYSLAWYFAANHIQIDSFDKRGQKGFVFTIGDEPYLKNLPASAVKGIMGDTAVGQGNFTAEELLAAAQEKNHVFHIFLNHGSRSIDRSWKQLLGDNLIEITDYNDVSRVISETVLANISKTKAKPVSKAETKTKTESPKPSTSFSGEIDLDKPFHDIIL